MSHYWQIS